MWWKWLVGIAAVPVALAGVVYGVGALLPREHEAFAERRIGASPGQIAALIRDVQCQPLWRSQVTGIEITGRGANAVRYIEHQGSEAISFELIEEIPDQRFRSTITDPALPFGGSWLITLRPDGNGTAVLIKETGEIRDPLYRFVSTLILGFHGTMTGYLADLDQQAPKSTTT